MEFIPASSDSVVINEYETATPLHAKIQKLIDSFNLLKGKYSLLKDDYERTLTSNIELEELNSQLMNEKTHLEQKITQLGEELQIKINEIKNLKETNKELDSLTKEVADKIDTVLSEFDLEDE